MDLVSDTGCALHHGMGMLWNCNPTCVTPGTPSIWGVPRCNSPGRENCASALVDYTAPMVREILTMPVNSGLNT
jgi:hypothetical protein